MESAHPPHAPWNRKRELKRPGTRHGPQDVQQGLPIARFHLLSAISFQFFSNYESTCQSMHRSNPFPKSTTIKCCCNGTKPSMCEHFRLKQTMTFRAWLPKAQEHLTMQNLLKGFIRVPKALVVPTLLNIQVQHFF